MGGSDRRNPPYATSKPKEHRLKPYPSFHHPRRDSTPEGDAATEYLKTSKNSSATVTYSTTLPTVIPTTTMVASNSLFPKTSKSQLTLLSNPKTETVSNKDATITSVSIIDPTMNSAVMENGPTNNFDNDFDNELFPKFAELTERINGHVSWKDCRYFSTNDPTTFILHTSNIDADFAPKFDLSDLFLFFRSRFPELRFRLEDEKKISMTGQNSFLLKSALDQYFTNLAFSRYLCFEN